MKLALILALSCCATAQLIEVNIPDGGAVGRDAADALQVGLAHVAQALPATAAAARGDGPLVSTDLREALHVESGAVAPGAIQITLEINAVGLSPEAVNALGPWLVKAASVASDNLGSPLAQIGSDFERGMAARGDRVELKIDAWLPWILGGLAVLCGAAVCAVLVFALWAWRSTMDDVWRARQ